MGILFGAAHALTPGHSKAMLATYLTGSMASVPRALATSLTLSFTHVAMSVMIVLLSLPLTLFVMTFAVSRNVPEAGVAFAIAMVAGISFTLSSVAIASLVFKAALLRVLTDKPHLMERFSQSMLAVSGVVLAILATRDIMP